MKVGRGWGDEVNARYPGAHRGMHRRRHRVRFARISSSTSSGVISLMSWRNWCMRLTSRKKRSAIVVVLFHDFAFDVAIFLASYIIDERADFLGRQQHSARRRCRA
jgi:hypothetical protein